MIRFLKNIRFTGGISNDQKWSAPQHITEEILDQMTAEICAVIKKHIGSGDFAHFGVKYEKSAGLKIND